MIEVKNATLQYTTFKRSQGLKGVMHDFFKRSVIQVEALSDISLTINEGEMIGLIGRNGAGKTTLIKLLTGILPLRQGEIKIDQMLPYQREKVFLKNIGVLLGQRSQLIWDLPAIDTYDMLAAIYELPKQMYNARLTWLSEQLEVTELLYIPVRKLSLGQRVKCELIAALLHRPKYLFLDEPTLGLDFVTQKTIYKILRLENQYHKTTIITTSHYIKDIEQLADKVIILNKGKIIFNDKLEQLPKELTTEILFDIDFLNSKSVEKKLTCAPDKLNEILAKIPAERILRVSQRGMELEELILQFIKGGQYMKYLYVFLASLKAKLIYRTNIVLEYGLTILQVGVSIFVWEALYSQKALVVPNYSLEKLNVYLFLANFLALSFSVAPAFRLATQIKSGRLSTLLERPISLYGEHLAYFIGDQFLGIVINLCLVVYFGALSGISVLMLLLLVIYLAFAGVMFFSLMMILGMLAFWLIELWPLRSFVTACYLLFGGRYFPLSHLPNKVFIVIQYNPFSLVTDIPARFLTVGLSGYELMQYLIVTLGWTFIFLVIYRLILKHGLRLYEGVESI